jgi:hypothetical protein
MTFVDGALLRKQRSEALARRAKMVSRLQLTDLATGAFATGEFGAAADTLKSRG